ncbi:MAG: SprT family zinc-dependent metalloprotease [Bacillota bacterium]|nr:SprT family zinc-dependent metalloprotease [Bacillota bacterium]
MIPYKLYKGRRKTIALSFNNDVELIVKAPTWMKTEDVEAFITRKSEWVDATRERLLNARQKELSMRIKLESGDILPYLGRKLTLTVVREERSRGKIRQQDDRVILYAGYEADYEYRRSRLETWYRRQAAATLEERARHYAEVLGVSYGKLHVKDQRSRWGSCSTRGNLNFNWRIIMAPEAVCNYVIIHELCHLVHMDHSPEFWNLVESIDLLYRRHRMWLKQHGEELYII